MFTPAPLRAKAKALLESRADGPPFEWKVYEGTTHGFAARPNLALPKIKEAYLVGPPVLPASS